MEEGPDVTKDRHEWSADMFDICMCNSLAMLPESCHVSNFLAELADPSAMSLIHDLAS